MLLCSARRALTARRSPAWFKRGVTSWAAHRGGPFLPLHKQDVARALMRLAVTDRVVERGGKFTLPRPDEPAAG
jgi:hypothetical protein